MARRIKSALNIEQFKPLDHYGLPTPQLVLAIQVPKIEFGRENREYQFAAGRKWHKIYHETAGRARRPVYMVATPLASKPDAAHVLATIDRNWYGCDAGVGCFGLCDVVQYSTQLGALGIDCELSFQSFVEGFYPIDVRHLSSVSNDKLNYTQLDDLIIWKSGFERAAGSINRFTLAYLGRNKA